MTMPSWSTIDRPGWVPWSDAQRRIVDVLAFNDGLSLFEMVTEGRVMPGGPFELSVLALSELTDEALCIRQDWYNLDQIDDALDRFDMLEASHLGPWSHVSGPRWTPPDEGLAET